MCFSVYLAISFLKNGFVQIDWETIFIGSMNTRIVTRRMQMQQDGFSFAAGEVKWVKEELTPV